MSQLTRPIDAQGAIVPVIVTASAMDLLELALEGKPAPRPQVIRALADTGASQTCLHSSVLQALGLEPAGTADVRTALTGAPETRDIYEIGLVIPTLFRGEPLVFDTLEVVSTELQSRFGVQALLGRDVLERCLLVYHGPERQFTLAY